jgi:hypothetical protein
MNTADLKSCLLKTTILPEDSARLLAEFTVPTIRSTIDEALDATENSPPQANEWGGVKLNVQLGNICFSFQYVHGTLTEVLATERGVGQHAYVTGNGRREVLRKLEQEFGMDLNVEFLL